MSLVLPFGESCLEKKQKCDEPCPQSILQFWEQHLHKQPVKVCYMPHSPQTPDT